MPFQLVSRLLALQAAQEVVPARESVEAPPDSRPA
jgi:hypothetical protein